MILSEYPKGMDGVSAMCGRYQFSTEKYREFQQIVQDARRRSGRPAEKSDVPVTGDVVPTGEAPVLVASANKVVAVFQRWGIPGWRGGLVINARAETVCEKPMFRRSVVGRRCVIPASGYYEWDAQKHKYFFRLPDKPLYLAGIYDCVDGQDRFVVLTTAPNETVRDIHDRMPLILSHEQVRPWLTDPQAALELLTSVPPPLERSCEDGQLSLDDFM